DIVVPRRDDHPLGMEQTVASLDDPGRTVAVDPLYLDPGPDVERVVLGIAVQVVDDAIARRPLPKRARNAIAGQTRQPPDGMQLTPVNTTAPCRRHSAPVEDHNRLAHSTERRRGRKPGRTGPNHDDHSFLLHAPQLDAGGAIQFVPPPLVA